MTYGVWRKEYHAGQGQYCELNWPLCGLALLPPSTPTYVLGVGSFDFRNPRNVSVITKTAKKINGVLASNHLQRTSLKGGMAQASCKFILVYPG